VRDFDALLARARELVVPGRRALLGIAGSPGAGKSTLATALVDTLAEQPPPPAGSGSGRPAGAEPWAAAVPMDGFHLADIELARLGLAGRKGAPDTFDSAGYAALLHRLRSPQPGIIYAPAFDRTVEQPIAGSLPVGPDCLLIVTEGNYLLLDTPTWRAARAELDEVWFCEVGEVERRRRLIRRHVEFGKEPAAAQAWVRGIDEPNAVLVAATAHRADLLVAASAVPRPPVPPAT
jgi:pantothenate kinase